MKAFGSWALILVTLTAVMCFAFYIEGNITSSNPGLVLQQQHGSYVTVTRKSRKLKEEYTANIDKDETGHDEIEDYRPIDPVPSSKAKIRPGPIQHGTPLMPYIPKPSPPLVTRTTLASLKTASEVPAPGGSVHEGENRINKSSRRWSFLPAFSTM